MAERLKQIFGYRLPKYQERITTDVRDIPEAAAIIDEFTEKAKHTAHADWLIKNAALYFTYEDKAYAFGPDTLGTTNEVFDALIDEMIDRLFIIGAYDMFSTCDLD